MSRLESAIRRLEAQRDCLNLVADQISSLPGPVLELGLGNGRTYDHLRYLFPNREIFVFEREVAAHPDCIPDDDHLLLGDFRDSIPAAPSRITSPAALIHYDVGTGDKDASMALAAWIAEAIRPLTQAGTFLVGDQPMPSDDYVSQARPETVAQGRYHIYRVGGG